MRRIGGFCILARSSPMLMMWGGRGIRGIRDTRSAVVVELASAVATVTSVSGVGTESAVSAAGAVVVSTGVARMGVFVALSVPRDVGLVVRVRFLEGVGRRVNAAALLDVLRGLLAGVGVVIVVADGSSAAAVVGLIAAAAGSLVVLGGGVFGRAVAWVAVPRAVPGGGRRAGVPLEYPRENPGEIRSGWVAALLLDVAVDFLPAVVRDVRRGP